jgi:hypothetical protein
MKEGQRAATLSMPGDLFTVNGRIQITFDGRWPLIFDATSMGFHQTATPGRIVSHLLIDRPVQLMTRA